MNQITLDLASSKQLHGLGQVVELCDPSGHVLGRFVPVVNRKPPSDERPFFFNTKSPLGSWMAATVMWKVP